MNMLESNIGRGHRRPLGLFAIGSLVAAIGLAVPASAQQPDLAELESAAVAERELVLYHSLPEATANALINAFEAAHPGISVSPLRMVSSNLFARFAGEAEANVTVADVLISGSSQLYQQNPELFQTINFGEGESSVGRANEHYQVAYITPHVLTYNNNEISDDDRQNHLKSWGDLTDPRWSGRIVLSDPLGTTSNMSFYKVLRDEYGDQWLADLAANQPDFVEGASISIQQVAAGAFAMAAPTTFTHSLAIRNQGAPLTVYIPEDGPVHGLESSFAIPLEPPHPNAAELFGRWLFSTDGGQAVACSLTNIPVVAGVEGNCPGLSPRHTPAVELIPDDEQRRILDLLGRP